MARPEQRAAHAARAGRADFGAALVALLWCVAVVLALAACDRVLGLAREHVPAHEFGAARRLAPDAALVERIGAHPTPVLATLFMSSRERVPAAVRGVERDLVQLFDGLAEASDGRLSFTLVHPESSAAAAAHAAARGVLPRRVRTLVRDGWSEALVHSTIELVGAGGRSVLLEGLDRDDLVHVQRRMGEHLERLAAPTPARIALAAPEQGWQRLARELANHGDVERVDPVRASLAPYDVVVFVAPDARAIEGGVLERLEARRARGATLIVAAGAYADQMLASEGPGVAPPRLRLAAPDAQLDPLWNAFALEARDVRLLDPRSEDAAALPGTALPFRVRCIAPNQDFRRFPAQPNTTLLFPSPTALVLDEARLVERGWRAHVLATTSQDAVGARELEFTLEGPSNANGRALGKSPLLVELEPDDALEGPAYVFACAAALGDDVLERDDLGQRRALALLLGAATTDERLVAARGEYGPSATFGDLPRGDEVVWRSFALGVIPVVLLFVWRVRRMLQPVARRRSAQVVPVFVAAGVLVAALVLVPSVASLARTHAAPAPALTDLAVRTAASAGALRVDFVLPRAHALPADMRAAARAARSRLAALERSVEDLVVTSIDPSTLSSAERDALGVAERTVVRREAGRDVARRVRAGLVVRGATAEPLVIEFEDARAFEQLEFRLALAFHTALTGRRPSVDVASSTPRLSAAETHLEYQRLQLFAPTGSDVFSAARTWLSASGFDVAHVDPEVPSPPRSADVLVWLQPRRPTQPVLTRLVDHLRAGRGAFVAGQPFEVVARQEGEDLVVHWPRPTVCDLDELWLEGLGAHVANAIVFDRVVFDDASDTTSSANAAANTTTGTAAGARRSLRGASAPSFQVRAGDFAWHGGAYVALDEAALAQHGVAARVLLAASPRAWSFAWDGGNLPADVLAGPTAAAPARPDAPLVVELAGTFPGVDATGAVVADAAEPAPRAALPGRLVLAASSEFLANGHLFDARFGAPEFLVETVARLALPSDVAALAAADARPRRLDDVDENTRLTWRAVVTGAAPFAALLLLIVRGALRGSLRRRVRSLALGRVARHDEVDA